ncbi:hypothetical protein BDW60DRAFT_217665 [Aspergillus nidulans var. acristatus]
MDNDHPVITSLHQATYSMILFAIPHKGLVIDNIQQMLAKKSQQWRRTGEFITMVDADSALLQLPDHAEDKVPLNADHSIIVKYNTRNKAGYQAVLDKLQ